MLVLALQWGINYLIVHWAPVGKVLSPWHFLLEAKFWPLGGFTELV